MPTDLFALDRASVRRSDHDGHLHIETSPISKATVRPYYGREIPRWQSLGLDENHVYQLLLDPGELEKGAKTFNSKPLLFVHKPMTANDHDRSVVVGGVSDVEWKAPYLMATLGVWDAEGIEGIESDERRQLSAAYRYDAVMEPGVYEGKRYDGRMVNIRGNHVALVPEGRAGPDVIVSDAALLAGGAGDPPITQAAMDAAIRGAFNRAAADA